jgi:ketosteroid isomerase-like protein
MSPDLEDVVERYHRALALFVTGDSSAQEALFSRRDDVSLANPLGPPARGWPDVSDRLRTAAAQLSDGVSLGFERISAYIDGGLAYTVEIERSRAKLGDADEPSTMSLRVTTIFRREDDGWTIVHRHADPITSLRSTESVREH